jgi:hypothetical protein
MVGLFIDEILLKHVDLVIFEHNPFGDFAEALDLSGESLIFVDLLHEPGVLLWLCGVNCLRPSSLPVQHSFFASTHPHGVHLVH